MFRPEFPTRVSSLMDWNVLFCFLNFLSLLNLASTFDRENRDLSWEYISQSSIKKYNELLFYFITSTKALFYKASIYDG